MNIHKNMAAVLAVLKARIEFSIIKTQSFCLLNKPLVVIKVNEVKREVIRFNHKSASQAYAEAVDTSIDDEFFQSSTNNQQSSVKENDWMKNKGTIKFSRISWRTFLLFVFIAIPITVNAEEILVGMSTALSGSAQNLGKGMKLGIETYFKKINSTGGVNGNTLKLIAYDDGYEPNKCAVNMRKLIDEDNVLAVIGNVGTSTAIVSVPIVNERKILLFGAFSGAGVLRKTPPDRYIINYRASYAEETAAMVAGFIEMGIKPSEIAFFTQNDGYGDAGYYGGVEALKAQGYAKAEDLAHGRYTRNTVNVEDGVVTIVYANPRAVIMVGAYTPCAKFIKLAREFLPDTIYANVSFVGSIPLAKELESAGEGVIVTQVVPHFESTLPGVVEFRQDLATYSAGGDAGFVALEGYLTAKIFVEGLKRAGTSSTRESIVDALEGLNGLDIGIGGSVSYSKTHHQASHQVWPTIIKNGKYVSLNWVDLKKGEEQ
jgi:ABC-type branched-subunit amino acid transport system substrate-binding protein